MREKVRTRARWSGNAGSIFFWLDNVLLVECILLFMMDIFLKVV